MRIILTDSGNRTKDVIAWVIVIGTAALGVYACILFNGIAPALAKGIVSGVISLF